MEKITFLKDEIHWGWPLGEYCTMSLEKVSWKLDFFLRA